MQVWPDSSFNNLLDDKDTDSAIELLIIKQYEILQHRKTGRILNSRLITCERGSSVKSHIRPLLKDCSFGY